MYFISPLIVFVSLLSSFIQFCIATKINERPTATGIPRVNKALLEKEWEFRSIVDIRYKLSRNDRFVPVIGGSFGKVEYENSLSFLEKRAQLFDYGVYPGVEYRIKEIFVDNETTSSLTTLSSFSNRSSISFLVRPAYKLIPELERDWPVEIPIREIPWCLSRGAYNVVTVIGSTSLALTALLLAFTLSMAFTLSVVNTRSMVPNILPRDVMIVEKLTPALKRITGLQVANKGDVLFFKPNKSFLDYIESRKLPKIQSTALIVKRVGALTYSEKNKKVCYVMLGDNPTVSIDSRDWGCLQEDYIVGTPILRIWPLERIGPVGAAVLSHQKK